MFIKFALIILDRESLSKIIFDKIIMILLFIIVVVVFYR